MQYYATKFRVLQDIIDVRILFLGGRVESPGGEACPVCSDVDTRAVEPVSALCAGVMFQRSQESLDFPLCTARLERGRRASLNLVFFRKGFVKLARYE
jgi:hypothetical protein